MLLELDAVQIIEWAAMFDQEPWGFEIDNWRMGSVIATIANLFGRGEKDPSYQWSDFLPTAQHQKEREKPQVWQEQLAIAQAMQAIYGGKFKQKRKIENVGTS